MKNLIVLDISLLSCFHASSSSQSPAAATSATIPIRAASYNIRTGDDSSSEGDANNNWANRKADLSNLVKDISPDVIGFQEVQYNQLTYLKNQLSGYEFVGAFRNGGTSGEATPVAFLAQRFELLRSGTFWLSATPEVAGSRKWGGGIEDSGHPRICTWVLLADKSSGAVVLFACTHLDLKAGPRLAGMRLILSRFARFAAFDVPIVIVGDMNANETEDSIVEATQFMQDSLLVTKTSPSGPWRTFTGFKWKDDEMSCAEALAGYMPEERTANDATLGKRIDYIFSSSNIVVEALAIRNDARPNKNYYPSDHYPVMADLAVPCMNRRNMHSWIGEDAAMERFTGTWAQDVAYGLDGRAYLFDDVFTPYVASTGNVVTVEMTAQFREYTRDDAPDATAQAAVRLGTNGCFQVWGKELKVEGGKLKTGNAVWIDVEAEGVTPVSGEEYTLRTTFDYTANAYSVDVKTRLTEFTRLGEKINPANPANPVRTSFPLVAGNTCVSSVAFVGDTLFASLYGDCRYEITGFVADEVLALSNNVQIVLSAAKAAWLNSCAGGKATVAGAAAGLSEKEFSDAYLLNLDITDGNRSYAFKITDIDVGDTSVAVAVTLTRSGSVAQPINGVLKFYGAATLEAFKEGATTLGVVEQSNETFGGGETATATIPLSGETPPAFFKAGISEASNCKVQSKFTKETK